MKEKLTKSRLIEYGFEKESIKRLINGNNYTAKRRNDRGNFYACNIENLIYSGADYFLKTETEMPFPFEDKNLVNEYYNLNESIYLKKQQDLLGLLFCEDDAKEEFKESEIRWATDELNNPKAYQKKHKDFLTKSKLLTAYIKKLNKPDDTLLSIDKPKNVVEKLKIDRRNYPVLNSVFKKFKEENPINTIDEFYNENAESPEKLYQNVKRLVAEFSAIFFTIKVKHTVNLIKKLKAEREEQAINIQDFHHREDFKNYYNSLVLEEIEGYYNSVYQIFYYVFDPYDFQTEFEKLNFKESFVMWYNEFENKEAVPEKTENLGLSRLPVFDSIPEFLNQFTQYDIFQHNRYNYAKSKEENRVINIDNLIHDFQKFLMHMYNEDKYFIEKLLNERNFFNVGNTAFLSKENFIKDYNDKVIKTIERYCEHTLYSFTLLPEFDEDKVNKIAILNLKSFFSKWYEAFETMEVESQQANFSAIENNENNSTKNIVVPVTSEPLTQVSQIFKALFETAQKKATNNTGTFDRVYKCAAFCKILFHVGYIEKVNQNSKLTPNKSIMNFANLMYKLDISSAFKKPKEIQKYINQKIGNHEPLKNCFNVNTMQKYYTKSKTHR